jgi:hypothetical protein
MSRDWPSEKWPAATTPICVKWGKKDWPIGLCRTVSDVCFGPVAVLHDSLHFIVLARCYADPNGRLRPEAVIVLFSYLMNKLLLLFVLLAWVVSSAARAETGGGKVLPHGSAVACQQSVDDLGDRDRKPFSIHWKSYSVRQNVSTIVKFYEQRFGRPPDSERHGGFVWKLAGRLTYAIHPYTSGTPWLECKENHEGISTVILISEASPIVAK